MSKGIVMGPKTQHYGLTNGSFEIQDAEAMCRSSLGSAEWSLVAIFN